MKSPKEMTDEELYKTIEEMTDEELYNALEKKYGKDWFDFRNADDEFIKEYIKRLSAMEW